MSLSHIFILKLFSAEIQALDHHQHLIVHYSLQKNYFLGKYALYFGALSQWKWIPDMLLTSVVPLWDGDVSRDGGARVEDSLHSEVTLPWTDGELRLGLFTVLGPVLAFLRPLNYVALDVHCGCRARNMLRTKVVMQVGKNCGDIYSLN